MKLDQRFAIFFFILVAFTGMSTARPPNVLFILGDDQAWTDYGFMGHPDIQTPHLDRLASQSVVFERGYVSSPLCRPSLASMVTGLHPTEHGVTGNDVDGRNQRAKLDVPLRKQFHQHPSVVRSLVDAGYLAHQSGKWWEGSWKDGGFTHGMKMEGRHGSKESLAIGREGLKPIYDFVDMAVDQDKPFFLWYGVFLPHTPHNPPERLLKKYRSGDRPITIAKYYAMCDWFDETCGQLLDIIDKSGQRDNTLVIYVTDNGWIQNPRRNGYDARSKQTPYEGGVRTPIMYRWPGVIPAGERAELATSLDIVPTMLAAAGANIPDGLPGLDILPQLKSGDPIERDTIFG